MGNRNSSEEHPEDEFEREGGEDDKTSDYDEEEAVSTLTRTRRYPLASKRSERPKDNDLHLLPSDCFVTSSTFNHSVPSFAFPDEVNRVAEGIREELYAISAADSATGRVEMKDVFVSLGNGEDVETYNLPLDVERVESMIKHCEKAEVAHLGQGSKVDESKRKTWSTTQVQLPRELEEFDFPEAVEYLRVLLAPTASSITARFYKLLIYGPGDFFTPHVDSQYAIDQFGTLAVHLPTRYTGGDLVIGLKNDTLNPPTVISFSSEEYCREDCRWLPYAAWLSNVVHEVEPVVSGYRVVLVYHLHRNMTLVHPRPSLSAATTTTTTTPLPASRLLDQLVKLMTTRPPPQQQQQQDTVYPRGLVIILKHRYSWATMKACIMASRKRKEKEENERENENEREKEEEEEEGGSTEPLLRGKDALIYQELRQLRVPLYFRFLVEKVEVCEGRLEETAVGPFQRECAWLAYEVTASDDGANKPNLLTPRVAVIDANPRGAFSTDKCADYTGQFINYVCYGNWDCGNDYYYRQTCLVVDLFSEKAKWMRMRPLVLASYAEGEDNIFRKIRLHSPSIFRMVAQYYYSNAP